MESKQEHSPLPWAQHTFLIKSKHGDFVTHCGIGNLPPSRSSESEANARFIVKAVNAHDALVEALNDLVRQLPADERLADFNLDLAEAALALAQKES